MNEEFCFVYTDCFCQDTKLYKNLGEELWDKNMLIFYTDVSEESILRTKR